MGQRIQEPFDKIIVIAINSLMETGNTSGTTLPEAGTVNGPQREEPAVSGSPEPAAAGNGAEVEAVAESPVLPPRGEPESPSRGDSDPEAVEVLEPEQLDPEDRERLRALDRNLPPEVARRRAADRMRAAKHKRRVLAALWKPRGVAICNGADQCPWSAPGLECKCIAGQSCRCERIVWEHLQAEGLKAFGGSAIAGLVANTMIACVRADLTGDPRATDLKLKLLGILAKDLRKRQFIGLQERRLALAEAREGPGRSPLADLLAPPSVARAEAK
jgi:hypothetical protein